MTPPTQPLSPEELAFKLRSSDGTDIVEIGKPWPYVVDVPWMNGYGQTKYEWIALRDCVLDALNRRVQVRTDGVKRYRWHDDGMWWLETEAERRITVQWVKASDYDAALARVAWLTEELRRTQEELRSRDEQLATLQRDAARYQWLRPHTNGSAETMVGCYAEEDLDTAIDRAIALQEKGEKESV